MIFWKLIIANGILLVLSVRSTAQIPAPADPDPSPTKTANSAEDTESERWNLYYQATSIADYHGTFTAPYTGPLSLQDYPERDVSITTTLFFTARLEQNTFLVFNPEIAGGKGFSGVNGFADQPNGEIPRLQAPLRSPTSHGSMCSTTFGFGEG